MNWLNDKKYVLLFLGVCVLTQTFSDVLATDNFRWTSYLFLLLAPCISLFTFYIIYMNCEGGLLYCMGKVIKEFYFRIRRDEIEFHPKQKIIVSLPPDSVPPFISYPGAIKPVIVKQCSGGERKLMPIDHYCFRCKLLIHDYAVRLIFEKGSMCIVCHYKSARFYGLIFLREFLSAFHGDDIIRFIVPFYSKIITNYIIPLGSETKWINPFNLFTNIPIAQEGKHPHKNIDRCLLWTLSTPHDYLEITYSTLTEQLFICSDTYTIEMGTDCENAMLLIDKLFKESRSGNLDHIIGPIARGEVYELESKGDKYFDIT